MSKPRPLQIPLLTEREVTPYKWVHPDEDERH